MGASQIGVVHVPIYPTISFEDYKYIIGHAKPKLLFVSDKTLAEKLRPIVESPEDIQEMYSFNDVEGVKNWKEIVDLGIKNEEKYKDELIKSKEEIKADDLFTLIYTSGTTGSPKGVMLSHRNMVSNLKEITKVHPFGYEHRALSFLPLSHVYERMVSYSLHQKGIKRKIFFWAVNLGLKFELNRKNGWLYHLKLNLANKLVFVKWREAFGGNVEVKVSGGAALQSRLARVFGAAQMTVLEGYGFNIILIW